MDKKPLRIVLLDRDLRVEDHEGWFHPLESTIPTLGLYVLEEKHLKVPSLSNENMGPFQRSGLVQSLKNLEANLKPFGISLRIEVGEVMAVLKRFQESFHLVSISVHSSFRWTKNWIEQLRTQFPLVTIHVLSEPTMIHEEAYPWIKQSLPETYTLFRQKVEKEIHVLPPLPLPPRTKDFFSMDSQFHLLDLLGPLSPLPQSLGESEGQWHLHRYFEETQRALTYKKTRNGMLRFEDSTRFSPYLAFGNLSARFIYHQLKAFEKKVEANESTYWIWFELLWRDYFYFLVRPRFPISFPKQSFFDPSLQAWMEGKTGYPLVDASMRELIQTGWLSNRGRQNVASFLVHGLKLPFALGEAVFRHYLLDYEGSSNLGNWEYLAGVGADPRENRIFNVTLQFKKYDSQADYVKHWLPELHSIPVPLIYQPWKMTPQEQLRFHCQIEKDYPLPIVRDSKFELN